MINNEDKQKHTDGRSSSKRKRRPSYYIGIWCRRLFHVYARELVLIVRDKGLLLFFTFLPLVYPVIYSLIYNPEVVRKVEMIVVDNDRSQLSRETVRQLGACEQAWVRGYAANLTEAREAMNRGECFGILEIPEGFGRKIERGETGNAVMYCDMSLLLRYKALLMACTNVMENMGAQLMAANINRMAPLAGTISDGNLMPINNASLGNIKSGFDSFIMPAILMLIFQQCTILVIGMAGGAKHENPQFLHYNPDNMTRSTVGTMIAQSLAYITIMFIPTVFLIHYVPMMFKFPMAGNFLEELAFLLPFSLASIGVGFVFQSVVTERESVFVSWVVTSLFFLMISGIIWPRYDMPAFWRGLGAICPSTWAVEGFVKMNSDGARLWQVNAEYINLWIQAAGWWAVAWCCQRWIVHPEIQKSINMRNSIAKVLKNSEQELPDPTDNEKQDEA